MDKQYSSWHLRRASEIVRSGGVIAYPTEAVYGFGCDPWNPRAVAKILRMKRRPISKGLIVIASDLSQLESLITFPNKKIQNKVTASWPGSFTWIVPASDQCPHWLTGDHSGLAVRVTAHPLCRALCDLTGPIVSTSANVSDQPAVKNGWRVQIKFGDQLDYILRGSSSGEAFSTTITDAVSGKQIR